MCKNCCRQLKLISFRWDDDKIIYKYRCDNCKEIIEMYSDNNDDELKNIIDNGSVYNKYNL